MYEIEKLHNHFNYKTFCDAHIQKAYETLNFEDVRFDCYEKLWHLFGMLKESNTTLIQHFEENKFENVEFPLQRVYMGGALLGLECVATYTKNIGMAIARKDFPRALELFDKYHNQYKVFDNAEKALKHYIDSLTEDFQKTDLKYFSLSELIDKMKDKIKVKL